MSSDGPGNGPQFHVLRDYAFIADGQRGALVGPDGALAWMCFPAWHDPAVFAGLIGSGGVFRVGPVEPQVWGGYYEPDSLIWRSRWVTGGAIIECRQALACPAARDRVVVLQRVVAVEGTAHVAVVLQPAGDYGRSGPRPWRHVDRELVSGSDRSTWRLAGAAEAVAARSGRLAVTLEIPEGQHRDLVLEIVTGDSPSADQLVADELWQATEHHWAEAVPAEANGVVAERDVRHSVAVLHGLTAPSGGTVAAATASLPERAEAGRSYDYRYVWIRDLCYVGMAGAELGAPRLVEPATRFVSDRLLVDGDRLMPAYTVDGNAVPGESHLGLPGYPGGGDVIGNHVRDQFQLDALGEALRLFAAADEMGLLDASGWRAAGVAARAIETRWPEPDAGVWELEDQHWTHSRLICVAGLRAISARPSAPTPAWEALADAITATTSDEAVHPSGRWQRSPNDERVDASLLLPGMTGAIGPTDQRTVATYRSVADELTEDRYVYRFRQTTGQPLGAAEGAFVLCNFWMSLAALDQDDPVEAARWFERGRAGCGPPGLFSEEFDVDQRQLRGNIPQAFVHAELIHAAAAQSRRTQ